MATNHNWTLKNCNWTLKNYYWTLRTANEHSRLNTVLLKAANEHSRLDTGIFKRLMNTHIGYWDF